MTKTRTDQPDASSDLSEAARAVVRDAGDPRIDAHLRALGLAMDDADTPDPAPGLVPVMAPESAETVETVELRSRVADLEAALAASGRTVRTLTVALVVAIVAVVLLAGLLVIR